MGKTSMLIKKTLQRIYSVHLLLIREQGKFHYHKKDLNVLKIKTAYQTK